MPAPPVAIHRFSFRLFAVPVSRAPIRLRDVSPCHQFAPAHRSLVAMVSLCPPPLLPRPPGCIAYLHFPAVPPSVVPANFATPASITVSFIVCRIPPPPRHAVVYRHDGSGLHAPLHFSALYASAVRPSFNGDFRFTIVRALPIFVGHLLFPLAVHAPQGRRVRGFQPLGFGQSLQIFVMKFSPVSRRTMDFIAAFASSSVVESTPMVLPF